SMSGLSGGGSGGTVVSLLGLVSAGWLWGAASWYENPPGMFSNCTDSATGGRIVVCAWGCCGLLVADHGTKMEMLSKESNSVVTVSIAGGASLWEWTGDSSSLS